MWTSVDASVKLLLVSDSFFEQPVFKTQSTLQYSSNIIVFLAFTVLYFLLDAVVTTDIFDSELKAARESRWEKTYGEEAKLEDEREKDVADRKATIVIELVIQASDVSHTMQHWHVYQCWNHKLLKEQYTAYTSGRLEKNPIESWYGGGKYLLSVHVRLLVLNIVLLTRFSIDFLTPQSFGSLTTTSSH